MAEDNSRLEQAADFFYHLVCNNEKRLQNGLDERERMRKQLQDSGHASGYRAAWLRKSSHRVLKLLQEIATEFDSIYTNDRFSAFDLIDVLTTAQREIKNRIESDDD